MPVNYLLFYRATLISYHAEPMISIARHTLFVRCTQYMIDIVYSFGAICGHGGQIARDKVTRFLLNINHSSV